MKKIALYLLLIPMFMGCQKGTNNKEDAKARAVNIAFASPVRSLDPRVTNEFPSCHVINMLYEGLMHLDIEGNPTYGVAESVDLSEDQLTYTFHLRDSKWSNGDPVTAFDFEHAWKKSVDPCYVQTGAYTFYSIKNVAACLEKKVSVNEVGIRALDEKTLQVELEHPVPYFLFLTACSTYSPINKKIDQEHDHWSNEIGEFFVCNGPFKPKKWKKSVEIILEKNENYWEAETVKIPEICLQIIPDVNTQFYLFEKGKIDWIGEPLSPLPFDIINDKNVGDKLETMEMLGLNWIFVNTEKFPFNNKNIRKAFAYAVNRQEIAEHVFQLGEVPAYGILNSVLALQKESYFDDANPKKAREYLEKGLSELGVTKEDLDTITLSQRTCIFTLRVSQAIQQQINEALGLQIDIEQADFPVHFNKLAKGNFSIGELAWVSWLRDPIYMLDTFRMRSFATNMSRWENETYKKYLDESDHELDPVKRKRYLQQAEAILMDEMPVIPLCFKSISFLRNPKLKNVYVSPSKEIEFRYAFFEE